MTTTTKIVLKTLIELESEINSGKTAYAAGINHGNANVQLTAPGRYLIVLEANGCGESTIYTAEGKQDTLAELIARVEWDEAESLDIEFKTYLGQQIWFIGDDAYIDPWNDSLFVWPENHVESIDVIHAAQAATKKK
jgi:hypothetical protein